MTCDVCSAELVAQRMPTRMRFAGAVGFWEADVEQEFWAHRVGTKCGPTPTPDETGA